MKRLLSLLALSLLVTSCAAPATHRRARHRLHKSPEPAPSIAAPAQTPSPTVAPKKYPNFEPIKEN
jgi:PBP1b-binding outer membrane lipoprotein LpoB